MKITLKRLVKLPPVRFLSSVRLTVFCLLALFFLVFAGTVYQSKYGLYLAQEKFFFSFFFLAYDVIPVPGGQLVLWVLFINLVLAGLKQMQFRLEKVGIMIIHSGILMFFIAAFATFHLCEETHLSLMELESSNVSSAYRNWEIAVWQEKNSKKHVVAFDSDHLKPGQVLQYPDPNNSFSVLIESYFDNCNAYQTGGDVLNASGIKSIRKVPADYVPEKNTPGALVWIKSRGDNGASTDNDIHLLLYGGETQPTPIKINNETYYFNLRFKRYLLPFSVKLLDFRMDVHPGTQMASKYESDVEIQTHEMSRKSLISMNNPLRYKDYTFYQSSYAIDGFGRETSTLAVVKNSGRILPYVASLVTFGGLLVHFAIAFAKVVRRKEK